MKVTREDLARLPLRAIVCFAARAARRVYRLYTGPYAEAVGAAIDFADEFAAGGNASSANAAANAAAGAYDAASDAANASTNGNAANAAVHAALSRENSSEAYFAYEFAYAAAQAAHVAFEAELGAWSDFRGLLTRAQGGVDQCDPSEDGPLGPLWPDGTSVAATADTGIDFGDEYEARVIPRPLELLIDPGSAPPNEIGGYLREVSRLYEMMGGEGIDFTVIDCKEPAMEAVGDE